MKVPNKPEKFAKESDLCAEFIAAITRNKSDSAEWVAYPETQGWDILLARKSDGAQIGIQAKLRLNNKVVAQTLPDHRFDREGPDYRAVLVPDTGCSNDLTPICAALGITVILFRGKLPKNMLGPEFHPFLPRESWGAEGQWHQWAPLRRHVLPDYVPDVAAGSAAPVALTKWKISAIKLAVLLEIRPVTRADFKVLELSPSRWFDPYSGWLKRTDGGFVAGPRLPDFRAQHPVNFEQIKADLPKWGAKLIASRLLQLQMEARP